MSTSRKPREDALWRKDLSAVPNVELRLARYALQIVARCPFLRLRLSDAGLLGSLWYLILPLLDRRVLARHHARWNLTKERDELPGRHSRRHTGDYFTMPSGIAWVRMRDDLEELLSTLPESLLQRIAEVDGNAPTSAGIRSLVDGAALDPVESALMDFVEKRQRHATFREFLRNTGSSSQSDHHDCLVAALDVDSTDIQRALRSDGKLRRLRLITRPGAQHDLSDFLSGEDLLEEILQREPASFEKLLECMVQPAPRADCQLEDFPQLSSESNSLQQVLVQAHARREVGINVLLYGPTGTGKTQFALALAAAVGLKPVMVRTEANDGEALSRQGRLGAFQLAQRLLRDRRDCLIVFDEVEDVFQPPGNLLDLLRGESSPGLDKGWMNRALEENPVPSIWITNNARSMDPAFLRRFLIPVAISTPTRRVRQQIAVRHLGNLAVPDDLIDELSADEALLPAHFAAARRAVMLQPGSDPARVVRETVSAMRRVQLGSPLKSRRVPIIRFDHEYLNVDGPFTPAKLCEVLTKSGRGTLCFHGAPGTGKTELAHVLADALGRELVERSAAGILSRWVGGTEQNLARLFNETDPHRCVLLLDEVDSLLRDRADARRSWEASMVNELLQQMERYPGIFIATTNLVETLDRAALRRFDFKLQFHPLHRRQRRRLYAREALGDAGLADQLPRNITEALDGMTRLTAGDFANVTRQRQLLGEAYMPEQYLRRLAAECGWRQEL